MSNYSGPNVALRRAGLDFWEYGAQVTRPTSEDSFKYAFRSCYFRFNLQNDMVGSFSLSSANLLVIALTLLSL